MAWSIQSPAVFRASRFEALFVLGVGFALFDLARWLQLARGNYTVCGSAVRC